MFRIVAFFLASIFASSMAFASGTVPRPDNNVGSNWTFKIVDGVAPVAPTFTLAVTAKPQGGYEMTRHGTEGVPTARYLVTRNFGQGTPVCGMQGNGNLYDFPLVVGKSWITRSFWMNERGECGSDDVTYTVMRFETLKTAAGSFRAAKVVGKGQWVNLTQQEVGGLDIVLHYAPRAQMTVRSERVTKHGEKQTKDVFELTAFSLK